MSASGPDELVTIGVFARACGLTPSALRFYDDSGLLSPARIDPVTGYRYYSTTQRDRAATIRRLREIDVPLEAVTRILSADRVEAARVLDEHVRLLHERAATAAAVAAELKASLPVQDRGSAVTLSARLLAEAVRQVRRAAAAEAEFPILTGILIEVGDGAVVLTATDRYRLSTRSLPAHTPERAWTGVVSASELDAIGAALSPDAAAILRPDSGAVDIATPGLSARCAVLEGEYPDYRTMLDALPPARTRVVTRRDELFAVAEGSVDDTVRLVGASGQLTASVRDGPPQAVAARVDGPDVALTFRRGNLLAALETTVGPDVMLDISAPDLPVVFRSATDGDLTTLAMPTASDI